MFKSILNWFANIRLRLGWITRRKKLIADIAMLEALAIEAERRMEQAEKELETPGILFGRTKVLKALRFHKHNAEDMRRKIHVKQSQLKEERAKLTFALNH